MPSSSSLLNQGYDVFLSFRGFDTRNNFTAFLHEELKKAKIKTFYDEEECETGKPLKPILENAIKSSRASVIVLSTTFASSTWCLDELALILDQSRNTSHIAIPIFYLVENTDIRNHTKKEKENENEKEKINENEKEKEKEKEKINSFQVAIAGHIQKMEAELNPEKRREWSEKIERWKTALTEVSPLGGHPYKDASTKKEPQFIDEIIKDILKKLSILLGKDQRVLTGVDDHVDFISSWLEDGSIHTADILTIYGMDGVGKTSLAQYIYFRYYRRFQRHFFIGDIKETLLNVKKRYFQEVLKPSSLPDKDKRVFVVLDNVDSLHQLDVLLGDTGFHPGSKIIITTRDASLTERCALFNSSQVQPKHTKLLHEGLDRTASLQLLCSNAFKCDSPKEGYKNVCEKLVKYCQGHPKALEVLVQDLRGRDADYWEVLIKAWKNSEIPSSMVDILQRSFDSLGSKDDKELFKHIAFFFAGKDRIFAETILDKVDTTDIPIKIRIQNLTDRCLLTIGPRNELMMHQLLQVLGRQKVRQESSNQWMRSRLWCYTDSYKALRQEIKKKNILGMVFDRRVFEKKKSCESHEAEKYYLSKMNNLMLLQLNYVKPNWSYEDFPKELRWLCMHGFPEPDIPIELPMKNLVALDLSHSGIKVFDMSENKQQLLNTPQYAESHSKDTPLLPSLKILNLSFCYQLSSLRGFRELPIVERLILASCRSLTEIHESIGHCHGLVLIDLSYCSMLKTLPSDVFELKKLTALSLDGCDLLELPIEISDTEIFRSVNANMIDIDSQVSSSDNPESLPRDIRSLSITLPSSLHGENNLHNESFPMAFSTLSVSEKLILDGNPIVFLPNCVSSLRRIELLSLEEGNMLETIKHTSCAPRNLKFSRWELLQKIKSCTETSSLPIALAIYLFAHSLIEMEGIVKIQPMAGVEEAVKCRLGWSDLDLMMNQVVETRGDLRRKKRSQVQLFYEFGIFSTYYGGKEIPNWIDDHKSPGSSISFTLSSSQNLRGLNFCYLQSQDRASGANLPTVIVRNITKKRTWIYKPCTHWVKVKEECLVWLSHWMFGKNEMEAGSEVTITIPEDDVGIRECRVSLVYDDIGEQDPLGYYKSWDHIIGRDLSAFRLTTGEYFLDNHRFYLWHIDCPINRPFLANGTCYEEKGVYFRKELPHIVREPLAEPENEESSVGVEDEHMEPKRLPSPTVGVEDEHMEPKRLPSPTVGVEPKRLPSPTVGVEDEHMEPKRLPSPTVGVEDEHMEPKRLPSRLPSPTVGVEDEHMEPKRLPSPTVGVEDEHREPKRLPSPTVGVEDEHMEPKRLPSPTVGVEDEHMELTFTYRRSRG